VERLRGPVERARRAGLTLGLENEYTTLVGTCAEVRQVVDAVDSPALRICWDVASGWYTGEPILPAGYAQVRGRLCDVHVRDAAAQPGHPARHGQVCLLDEGAIDWTAILSRLRADGYRGPCTLEPHLALDEPQGGTVRRTLGVRSIRALTGLLATIAVD
jgi:sugar phosphate isomerase/epimerase